MASESNDERFKYLLLLYETNNLSVVEHGELFEMIAISSYDQLIEDAILADLQLGERNDVEDLPAQIAQEIIRNIYDTWRDVIKASA